MGDFSLSKTGKNFYLFLNKNNKNNKNNKQKTRKLVLDCVKGVLGGVEIIMEHVFVLFLFSPIIGKPSLNLIKGYWCKVLS